MSAQKSQGSIKGFLDVKIPARKRKSISLFRVQVWKRKCWVVVRGDRSPADVGTPSSGSRSDQVSLSVEIYTQHEGINHPTEGTILHLDLVHKIRRAKSKSHPYAFEVCGRRGEALLYLSGKSESESQKWMSGVRNILWPPNHLENIMRAYPKTWEVSSISMGEIGDDWTSLGGLYGRLAVSEANILIKDINNGTTRVEWPLTSVQKVYVATGGEADDEGKIFIVQTRPTHPYGETFLYFFCADLSDLLEGLHDAVSCLITKNYEDDSSVLSDLSELSGALSSVVILPQRFSDTNGHPKLLRKSTSVLDMSQVIDIGSSNNSTIVPRLSSSQSNIADETIKVTTACLAVSPSKGIFSHFRRRSMSETNITKICLDETDEELDSRDDDLEDPDLRHMDVPKDRTSSSGSYNSYRSNDSGVKLSASPSNYADGIRVMMEHNARRFVANSDCLDSGVRACMKEENKPDTVHCELEKKGDMQSVDPKSDTKKSMRSHEEEPDVDARVSSWCMQNAKARRSLFVKNVSTCAYREPKKIKSLSRTLSESYKETVDRNSTTDEYKKAMDNPILSKHTTVYEEIVDVLRPLSEKKIEKEHDYEELEKYRHDIKRSFSFQEKNPPPLPPRRPKSFSPDPWVDNSTTKTSTLRKIFGLTFHNKSRSTDSMVEVDTGDFEGRLIPTSLGSDDMATVQALGTLPRIKRKSTVKNDYREFYNSSPRMSPKQKAKNSFGVSPNRSPRAARPRNLFIFKPAAKEDVISPNTQAALKLHRQLSIQAMRTPSTDSSLADIPTPEAPKPSTVHRGHWKSDYSQIDTPDTSEDSTPYATAKDPSLFLKSPKIVTKTFNFLRKFPKEKYSSLERKRKSAICSLPLLQDPAKVPNSFSMDSFAVEEGGIRRKDTETEVPEVRPRAMSFAPSSPGIQIPKKSCCYSRTSISPAGTPTSCSSSFSGRPGTPPPATLSWKDDFWNSREGRLLPPPPAPCEPQYANLDSDPDYMTVEEIRSTFKKKEPDDGGYLSMGDLRTLASTNKTCSAVKVSNRDPPPKQRDDIICGLEDDYSIPINRNEEICKHRASYSHVNCSQLHQYGLHRPSLPTEDTQFSSGYKSAPSSRKPSCCEASEYLTPQEVSRLLRRELVSAHVREMPFPGHHHHHHHH